MWRRTAIVLAISLIGGSATADPVPVPAAQTAANAQAIAAPVPLQVPLPRPRPPKTVPPAWAPRAGWHEPHSFRDAAGPDFKSADVTSEPSACRLRLEKIAVVEPMPRLIGPGACGGTDIVRLDAVKLPGGAAVEIKPAPYLRCPMAEQLARFVRDDAAPQVASTGAVLRELVTYDDFDCRGRNRKSSGKISEHGKADAVDVRGLGFADGRVVKLTDVNVSEVLRAGLRKSACARFTTVLGPGSDGYHEEHIHLDFAQRHNGYRICQWEVRKPPLPPLPPPLPPKPPAANEPEKQAEPAPTPEPAKQAAPAAVPTPAVPAAGPVEFPGNLVPLPHPRPKNLGKLQKRRKSSGRFHFPFNFLR